MIYGIGTDICDIRRIRASVERHGEQLALRVLSDNEYATWQARSALCPARGIRYLATRFSAKEAFSKAVGLGLCLPMRWRDCEITSAASGKPEIILHGALKVWVETRQLSVHISVTDETDYAARFCVIEQTPL